MIDVSVIICTYNRLWCLPRAIESCRNTVCNTEIIVVDDGSTDGTWEWLQRQSDIKSFFQENQGQTYAINYGVSKAEGKYVRFLDSDDFLHEDIIDRQFKKAEATGTQLVYSKVDNYVEETKEKITFPEIIPWNDFLKVQLSNEYGSHFLGMLFLTSWVKKTPRRPEFAFREDRMFLLEYLLLEPVVAFAEGCAGYWVQHRQQMQRNYSGLKSQVTNWQYLTLFKRILDKLNSQGKLTAARKEAACSVLWPLAHWIAKDFIKDADHLVQYIYELNPEFKIPNRGLIGYMYRNFGFVITERILKVRRFFKYGTI